MSYSFEKHFPYAKIRPVQKEVIQTLQDNWENFDVFVLSAPTALGKSAIARTLMTSLRSVSLITPTNMLVQQFLQEFPGTPTLSRLDSYYCEEWKRPCPKTKSRLMKFCSPKRLPDGTMSQGCQCSKDMATAKFQRGPGVYNYHTYMAHKLYRTTLVVDEAQNLSPVIRDRLAIRIWKHDVKYPHTAWSNDQIRAWIDSLPENKQKNKKMKLLREAVSFKCPDYIAQRTEDWFNGKGTLRGEPELRDCIKLLPVDISQAPPMMWPQEVEKIVLMSGTISKKDVEALGLTRKKVLYIECKSPIPVESRPIYIEPVVSVSRANMESATQEIAAYCEYVAGQFPDQKGVIHATYAMARDLRDMLPGSRYLFHTPHNKADVYREFRDASPESGKILVASGLYEGIDLPEDAGRWQIIAKVPWPSLANPAVKHLAELDPEHYNWECLKVFIQACGRICRTEKDYGVTLCPDASFLRLVREAQHMFPTYFKEALIYLK